MRAAVLANLLVLGACGRHDAATQRPAVVAARTTPARDVGPRAGVTHQSGPSPGAGASTTNTSTPAHPDSVPSVSSASAATPARVQGMDTPPQMRNVGLPFRYPGALYAHRVQGNVTLRLWIDAAGRVHPDSTRIAESSGARLLDSAAVAGSARLEFTPARRDGHPVAAPLLFPVHFRHPAARPSPAAGPPAPPRVGAAGRGR